MKYSLAGVDGNAFSVMGYVKNAMRKEGKNTEETKTYSRKAMSGNYDNLLMVSQNALEELNKKEVVR